MPPERTELVDIRRRERPQLSEDDGDGYELFAGPRDDDELAAIEAAVIRLLRSLTGDWQGVDISARPTADKMGLYLLCGCGLVEERVRGRTWGPLTALDFEATVSGVWLDSDGKSILPEEIRRCVPAWAGQNVAVQLSRLVDVRLTVVGGEQKREIVDGATSGLVVAYLAAHPIKGRCQVRLLGNEGTAPGHVGSDILSQELIGKAGPPTAKQPGRGIDVERRLKRYIAERTGEYKRLIRLVLSGDGKAVGELKKIFGPTAIARHLAPGDREEQKRVKTAVQGTRAYETDLKPLFEKPPRAPEKWEEMSSKTGELLQRFNQNRQRS